MVNRKSRIRAVVQYLPGLVIGGVVAGLVLSLIAIPVVAGVGLLARNAVEDFEALPDNIELPELSLQNTILDKDGQLIATYFAENRILVPLDKIAPVLRNAIVAVEDYRFYEHGAIDLQGTLRAFLTNVGAGGVEQGASTITQQLVQNIQITEAGGNTEVIRDYLDADLDEKIQELKFAITLEQNYTKDEILQAYLNITYFGSGTYGVEAAARYYFNTTAAKLTLEQAALLAGMVARPNGYNPTLGDESYTRAAERRNVVIERMADLGMVSRATAQETMAKPIELDVTRTPKSCFSSRVAPLFCQYVVSVLEVDPAFGETKEERQRVLAQGGLTIRTTLDLDAQKAADRAVLDHVNPDDTVVGTLAMVQPGDGAIRALAQSKKVGGLGDNENASDQSTLNFAVDARYGGGGILGYQPGSTMKPFTAAAALAKGIKASHVINVPYTVPYSSFHEERNCSGGRVFIGSDEYDAGGPSNFSRSQNGPFDMAGGLRSSVNNYFMLLTDEVGLCNVVTMAKNAGVRRADGKDLKEQYAFTLGINEVSPLTMASAYATFAARGTYCEPYAVVSVTDRNGKNLPVPEHGCRKGMEAGVADTITYMLERAVQSGTGAAAQLGGGRRVAGKTGTTNSNLATSFVGYTPQLATAVAIWDPRGQGEKNELRDIRIGGHYYDDVFGGSIAAPIFKQAMDAALKGTKKLGFKKPSSSYLGSERVTVPDVAGMDPGEAAEVIEDARLKPKFADGPVGSDVDAGRVAYTDPDGGSRVRVGSTVTIYISSGQPQGPSGDRGSSGPPEPGGGND